MQLQDSDIKKLAKLSRIEIPEHQLGKFREQLTGILGYVEKIGQVEGDATGLREPVRHLREDQPGEVLATPKELLGAAPAVEEDHIQVQRIK